MKKKITKYMAFIFCILIMISAVMGYYMKKESVMEKEVKDSSRSELETKIQLFGIEVLVEAFNKALDIFENQFDYESSFEVISQALEVVEPGVTSRFVTSYEKTRENIRF